MSRRWAWLDGPALAWLLAPVAALLVTCTEAVLLDRQLGVFRGGFLAIQQLRGVGEASGFILASLLIDLCATGGLVVAGLAVASRLRLGRIAAASLALLAGAGPVLLADAVQFQIARFLGDVTHLRTLFGLVNASPSEILAVGTVGGGRLIAAVIVALLVPVVAIGLLHRAAPQPLLAPATGRRTLALVGACLVVGGSVVAVANAANARVGNLVGRKPSGFALVMAIRRVTDVDGDGYGWLSRPADPAPWDRAIAPYAIDVPGNGVDEDGLAGDLPADFRAWDDTARPAPRFARRPPFVLVVLESVRNDVLDARIGGKDVAPALNAMARHGRRYSRAYSLNGFTAESRFHIFTGSLGGPRSRTSLIDDFAANGYETAFFSAQDESFGGDLDVGFSRAEVRYDARSSPELRFSRFSTPGSIGLPATVIRDKVSAYVRARSHTRPLFLTVNFQDTHFPYSHDGVPPIVSATRLQPDAIRRDAAAALREMYLNTVAFVDRTIGELVSEVARAEGEAPAVVVVSDHGESLFEEGFLGHGYALNQAQTHVPLVVDGISLELTEPATQLQLRTAITCALSASTDCGATERASPARHLQYIGRFERPAVLASLSDGGVVRYDLFTERLSRDPPWPTDGVRRDSAEYTWMIRAWEAARNAAPPVVTSVKGQQLPLGNP